MTTFSRRNMIGAAVAMAAVGTAGIGSASASNGKKTLVIYFSRSGTTEAVADKIAAKTGCRTIKLSLVNPYADEYSEMTDIAREERYSGARREVRPIGIDLAEYDTVFIGTPLWWGGACIPMRTFLTDNRMAGKKVLPFTVSHSSSPYGVWEDIKKCCPEATIDAGFHTTHYNAASCDSELSAWLSKNGF